MEHSKLSFGQTKLTKNEWDYIEKPIQGKEKTIIEFIKNNFNNVERVYYPYVSLSEYLKISIDNNIQDFIIDTYFKNYLIQILSLVDIFNIINSNFTENIDDDFINLKNTINKILQNKYVINFSTENPQFNLKNNKNIKLKTKDKIKLTNTFNKKEFSEFINNDNIYDFVFIKQLINILHNVFNNTNKIGINTLEKTPIETKQKINKIFSYRKQKNKNNDNNDKNEIKKQLLNTFNTFVKCSIDKIYGLLNIINDVEKTYKTTFLTTKIVKEITLFIASSISNSYAMKNSCGWIENNTIINKYSSLHLYEHQKQICNIFNTSGSEIETLQEKKKEGVKNHFVYYCAPTGTGKTLTPLAIANRKKVIFVCAARHIGLTFARNAISCGYKIALAFNCNDSEDIRLHYSAAKVFTKNYKSGGIFKVDNTIGDKVDIIISDLKSYSYASLYMKAFNNVENIVTFWDEPTISLDYENHDLHDIIHKIWSENIIPNMVLSSATLPNSEYIENVAETFSRKFNCNINYIKTSEFNKSICIYDLDSDISTPHLHLKKMNASYDCLKNTIQTIKNDKTLMRYLHIDSCIDFINYVNQLFNNKSNELFNKEWYNITSNNIKEYYIETLDTISESQWNSLDIDNNKLVRKYYESNIYFLTKDAYTLTNGPSIFLTNDIFKIAKFCFQQLNINSKELEKINKNIEYNNVILNKVKTIEKQLEDEEKKQDPNGDKENKISRMERNDNSTKIKRLQEKLDTLHSSMKKIHVNSKYIPNTYEHLKIYANKYNDIYKNINNGNEQFKPFLSMLEDNDVMRIISIPDVDDSWRLLLMCGIGIVSDTMSNQYNILINEFASEKKLFMLIASSDYIYGTNYSFHHGYIGKDMKQCSRQKLIQALGRIGRGQVNQHYSIRMRDNEIIQVLYDENENNVIEAENMNKLFVFNNDENENDSDNENEGSNAYNEINIEDLYNEINEDGWIVNNNETINTSTNSNNINDSLVDINQNISFDNNNNNKNEPEYDNWEDAII